MKSGIVTNLKLDQLRWEINTMKRLLGFIMDENIHLKYRLSEVLRTGFDKKQLEHIEIFQNRFIMQDELIALLNNQIIELNESLSQTIPESKGNTKKVNDKIAKVGNNINIAEERYKKMKQEFNSYLSENIE